VDIPDAKGSMSNLQPLMAGNAASLCPMPSWWQLRPWTCTHCSATISQCTINTVSNETRARGRHCWLKWWQIIMCTSIRWLNSALNGKEHTAMLSVLVKEFQTLFPVDINTLPADFQMEHIELQSGIQLKNPIMSVHQTYIRPLLPERSVLCFAVKPYWCHHFVTVRTCVNNCQGWSTGWVKFHQKSLVNTLRAQ